MRARALAWIPERIRRRSAGRASLNAAASATRACADKLFVRAGASTNYVLRSILPGAFLAEHILSKQEIAMAGLCLHIHMFLHTKSDKCTEGGLCLSPLPEPSLHSSFSRARCCGIEQRVLPIRAFQASVASPIRVGVRWPERRAVRLAAGGTTGGTAVLTGGKHRAAKAIA